MISMTCCYFHNGFTLDVAGYFVQVGSEAWVVLLVVDAGYVLIDLKGGICPVLAALY